MAFVSKARLAGNGKSRHVGGEDIRAAFADYRDELMWLALFLTGDKRRAETCVVDACALATTNNAVFRDWLLRWARRATIRSAIEMKRSCVAQVAAAYKPHACSHRKHVALSEQAIELLVAQSDVLVDQLDVLCRFVLIMRGLENYSARDSALLLGIGGDSLETVYCAALQSLEESTHQHSSLGVPVGSGSGV